MFTINLRVGIALTALTLVAIPTMAADPKPNTQAAKDNPMGYFLGVSVGQQMAQQGFQVGDFDVASLASGVTDGLNKLDPALTEEQLAEVQKEIETLLRGRQEELMAEREKMAMLNKEKGELWMKQNAKKDGIKTLERWRAVQGVEKKAMEAHLRLPTPSKSTTRAR